MPYTPGRLPSSSRFLRGLGVDPSDVGYQLNPAIVESLQRNLWSAILASAPSVSAYLLPRAVAPSEEHALAYLKASGWKLVDAQRKAQAELKERARKDGKGKSPEGRKLELKAGSAAADLGPEYSEERRGMPCGHVFKKGEAIYRCRDCALDDTCVQCAPCFNASDHEGHDIVFSVSTSSGGCCDCGDAEAWKSDLRCKYHDADAGDVASSSFAEPSGSSSRIAPSVRAEPMDEDMDGMDSDDVGKGKEVQRQPADGADEAHLDRLLARANPEVVAGLSRILGTLLEFVLDTLEHAPPDMKLPTGPDVVDAVKRMSALDDAESDPEEARLFSVMLWNDEKHSFKDVIDIVKDATRVTELEAKRIAERVDRHGRELIEVSSEVRRLMIIARKLHSIDLAVTVRPAFDIFAEEVAHKVLATVLDLAEASLFVAPSSAEAQPAGSHPFDGLVPNAAAMRALVGRALLMPWNHIKNVPQGEMKRDFFDPADLRKVDGLLLMDHKMWKGARACCRALFMTVIGPREVKGAIAKRFARMYPKIVETFILRDREPEHSVCFMTVQLFSVPTIACELFVEQSMLEKLLAMLQSIFTGHLAGGIMVLPPPPTQANPQSMLLRQQSCYHIFYDVRYILSSEGVQRELVSDTRHLGYLLDFLALFNAIMPDRRQVGSHVEFESELWIPIFHVSTQLAKVAKSFGEAYAKADPEQLRTALGLAARNILLSSLTLHQKEPDVHAAVTFEDVRTDLVSDSLIDFSVESGAVSFHHPMHWLLAEMLKHLHKFTPDVLSAMGLSGGSGLSELLVADTDENGLLVLVEFPLRVIVKLAQIRVGMWVRNGFAIRSQAHHYRDTSMRDIMYDQDLWLVQCGFVFVKPSRMLHTIYRRFDMLHWLEEAEQGAETHEHTLYLAEEMLLLLITLLSETSIGQGWTLEQQVRREIVHFLALGQGTYSELTKHISDRFTDHSSFDRILAQVSKYRAPDGTTDLGIFELKPECYDEVQPYFWKYTRNQREQALQVLKDRHKKKGGKPEDFVAVPKAQLADVSRPFNVGLRHVLAEKTLKVATHGVLSRLDSLHERGELDEMPDSLIDAALHLVMLGLVELGAPYAQSLTQPTSSRHSSLLEWLLSNENDAALKALKPKITWLIERIAVDAPELAKPIMLDKGRKTAKDQQGTENGKSAEDAKRAAARARQVAIMQKFSAQQKSLLESLEDEMGEDGDDNGDEAMDADDAEGAGADSASVEPCILCQEQLDGRKAYGSLAHIQGTRIIRTTPRNDAVSLQQSVDVPVTLDRAGPDGRRLSGLGASTQRSSTTAFPAADHRHGFYASTCGHMMHLSCFELYLRSVEQRHAQQIARNHPEDLSRSEFICPLCKSLGNVLLPVSSEASKLPKPDSASISEWVRRVNIEILKNSTSALAMELQEPDHGTGSFLAWYPEEALRWGEYKPDLMTGLSASTYQMLERIVNVLRNLSYKARAQRDAWKKRTVLAPPRAFPYVPEELIAYTINVLEVTARGTPSTRANGANAEGWKETVAATLSDSTVALLRSLIHCLRSIAQADADSQAVLAGMKQGLFKRLLPHWGNDEAVRGPLLLRDPLTILIETAALAPESVPQVTTLMFYATLVQAVFGLAQPSIWPQSATDQFSRTSALKPPELSRDEAEQLRLIFPDVRWTMLNIIGFVGYARGNITLSIDSLDDLSLAKLLYSYTLPFLRRAAILHRTLGFRLAASEPGQAGEEPLEYIRLLRGLQIPMPAEALPIGAMRQTAIGGLVEGWIKHAYNSLASLFRPLPLHPSPLGVGALSAAAAHMAAHPTLQLEHPHIYELVGLPHDLADLLQEAQKRTCRKCKEVPPEPAICLLCGEIVCFQTFCCQDENDQRGECNQHVDECGSTMGAFFKVKTNIVVLLYQGNGTFTFSPYLDSHGEIDIGLRKGRPQRLHQQRYDELRKQVLGHGVASITARRLESSMDQGGWVTM